MIPKIIHQIWIQGYDNLPTRLRKYHNLCKEINNDFTHIFWDDDSIKYFLLHNFDQNCVDTYNQYPIFAQKSDFARYHILYIYGGIYLDMDMICKKNLSVFLKNDFFITSYILPDVFKRYLNGIIGSKPLHPVFLIIFDKMNERLFDINNITRSTGTDLFYYAINSYKKKDITIIPMKYLHPCNMYDNDDCANKCKDCYIVHADDSSWSPSLKSAKKLIKNIHIILILIIIIIIIYLINQ